MGGGTILEIDRPRSATELIGATFQLYRRYPWLFLVLAGVVVVPWQFVDLLETTHLLHGAARALVFLPLTVANVAFVLPLISALHVHAVDDVREGREPSVGSAGRRGIASLPVLAPAALVSWLGSTFGLLLLIVPGVLLFLRWSVVAQAAALGSKSWKSALGHSRMLTRHHYGHVFAALVLVVVITAIPQVPIDLVFGLHETTVPSFIVRTAVAVPSASFNALVVGLLYFDLLARLRLVMAHPEGGAPKPPPAGLSGRAVEPTGHRLDPDSYSDEDRPPGWYVIPEKPWRMRYWAEDGTPTWSRRTTKTPKDTLAGWHKVNRS